MIAEEDGAFRLDSMKILGKWNVGGQDQEQNRGQEHDRT